MSRADRALLSVLVAILLSIAVWLYDLAVGGDRPTPQQQDLVGSASHRN